MRRGNFNRRFATNKGKGMRPIIRGRKEGMNNLEEKYSKWLDSLKWEKQIEAWQFEPLGLKIAEMRCRYHPDFLVVRHDQFEFHEVKAFSKKAGKPRYEDDSMVKLKVAARQFPWFQFRMVWFDSNIGSWQDKPIVA